MHIDEFVAFLRRLNHPLVESIAQNENRELRTVMVTICGEQVEFVNLRTAGVGIPDVPPNLPSKDLDPWIDAHLRDLTVNVRMRQKHLALLLSEITRNSLFSTTSTKTR